MSSLWWIGVFLVLTGLSMWRGWFWGMVLFGLCIGIGLGQTAAGIGLYSGTTTFISGVGGAALAAVHAMVA